MGTGENFKPVPLPPHILCGVGLGGLADWVLPCPLSLHGRGQGTRDSPYKPFTTTSCVLSSMFPGFCIPTSLIVLSCNSYLLNGQSSHPSSISPPSSRWPYHPASSGSWGWGGYQVRQGFFSPTTSPPPYSLLGTRDCPSWDWDGGLTNQHFSLQPRIPNKKFQGWKIINRKKIYSNTLTI